MSHDKLVQDASVPVSEQPTRQSALYDRVAEQTASMIIREYSTSFGLAARLLGKGVRQDVENIYGLVRLADEIVDGVAAYAGVSEKDIRLLLDDLEAETEAAMQRGYSTNLVVHAFALTARRTGIEPDLTRPFFTSMRVDITRVTHTPESFDKYVYGSAEVVGLMCLKAFLRGQDITDEQNDTFVTGARKLGAAFQKVNFLRDLSADVDALGRSYFPGINIATFSEEDKDRLVADIDSDLAISGAIVPFLPSTSRKAVALAQNLFAELNRRIARTPASELKHTRVSVPTLVKARLAIAALLGKTS
ncbi:squalene/phytoene synthase family protein [Aurantimicrobium sp. MWH-Uga1]|uniref:phytoene/squalene synthase family protein n=1 Tax=Aurantimicrobium sp. MWH-Uga1 TaxID=2079575 RepID=UPI000DEDB9EB|nr:squalene/phytoene synthase family protein [Aurantimicrobium sp. MWH-Uga1]AXE55259.1 15-cis-phytoene synthase [Aurantimicrobium sp. MWH-Uga1]